MSYTLKRSKYSSFWLILFLFITGRLMVLMFFQPEQLATYSDYHNFFNSADMSKLGFYPFIDYWSEYPPVFVYLNLIIYNLAGQQFKNHIILMASFLIFIEGGNLYLLYRLAFTLYNKVEAIQTAWIYTALFIPFLMLLLNYDALTTFFILLSLYGLIKNKNILLAVGLGLGTMTKIIPIFLLATIWRAKGIKTMLLYAATTLLISFLFLAPTMIISPSMTTASLLSQVKKSSHQTVWAIIDGNYVTGNFGLLSDHFDADKATIPLHNPARIPSWLTIIPFAGLGLFIFTRPRILSDINADTLVFTALMIVIVFLWSPGWSPQWQTFLIPLLLLVLPEKEAVLFIVVLGFVNFLEWPIILSRGFNHLLPFTIIMRTSIFIILAIRLYKLLTGAALEPQKKI